VPGAVYSGGSRSHHNEDPPEEGVDGDYDEDTEESHFVICSLNLRYSRPRHIIILSL